MKENILLPLALANHSVYGMEEKVEEIATVLGIQSIVDHYPYQTSGGQKQRTATARAIIGKPSLVLADEPTGALDSKSSLDLLTAFKTINQDYETTILMVTHDALAASYCDRIVFMKDGGLVTELVRGDKDRKYFFDQLVTTLSSLGGGVMTLFNVVMKSLRHNFRQYFIYMASMVFSILIYFTFVSLQYNEQIANVSNLNDKMQPLLHVASFILLLFMVIFIGYSNTFLFKSESER